MKYTQLSDLSPAQFKRYTGVSPDTFSLMCEVLQQREAKKKKSGRPSKLCLEDQILMALTYWREYRTQFHIGVDFGVSDGTACKIINHVEDHLIHSGHFKISKRIPDQAGVDVDWGVVVVDATETPIERPKKQRRHYSGKKKQHTIKTQLVVHASTGLILSLAHGTGRTHDFKLFQEHGLGLKGSVSGCLVDSGYQGIGHFLSDVVVLLPFKSSKKKPLSCIKRRINTEISRRRIIVEHAIRGIKRFAILRERYRSARRRFGLRCALIAGLYNFELIKK